jgi:hypothetical protein
LEDNVRDAPGETRRALKTRQERETLRSARSPVASEVEHGLPGHQAVAGLACFSLYHPSVIVLCARAELKQVAVPWSGGDGGVPCNAVEMPR